MKSILSELYCGNIFPAEQYAPKSEEYRQIQQRNYQHYEDFIETLSRVCSASQNLLKTVHFKER